MSWPLYLGKETPVPTGLEVEFQSLPGYWGEEKSLITGNQTWSSQVIYPIAHSLYIWGIKKYESYNIEL
jgi:hypothetical protein